MQTELAHVYNVQRELSVMATSCFRRTRVRLVGSTVEKRPELYSW